ncbi:MAG TPA: hypothetical protein VKR57_03215 [Terriglobales bacterium]|nr:hypothetical protein [Terriglobales bacterium]
MRTCVVAVLCCITMTAMLCYAQGADEGYQTATVVSIEKLAADAQHMEKGDQFKISMNMGGALYLCKVSAPAATFMDWTSGKEFPAKENGKVLLVKNKNGQMVELNIAKKKAK